MATAPEVQSPAANGDRRLINALEHIYYDGYWIRYYAPLDETLANRKRLIDSLTRRAFHHTEAGINTPGKSLDLARAAYEIETDPERKRINAAMLAGRCSTAQPIFSRRSSNSPSWACRSVKAMN